MVKNADDIHFFSGKVIELLKGANFLVELENKHTVIAYASGKMIKEKIRVIIGDQVTVQVNSYDNKRGIIRRREKIVK